MRSPPQAYSMTKQTCFDVWKHANKLIKNGCLTAVATSKILFSDIKLSTSSLAIMSPFFNALIAKYSPVCLYLLKITFEKQIYQNIFNQIQTEFIINQIPFQNVLFQEH